MFGCEMFRMKHVTPATGRIWERNAGKLIKEKVLTGNSKELKRGRFQTYSRRDSLEKIEKKTSIGKIKVTLFSQRGILHIL